MLDLSSYIMPYNYFVDGCGYTAAIVIKKKKIKSMENIVTANNPKNSNILSAADRKCNY